MSASDLWGIAMTADQTPAGLLRQIERGVLTITLDRPDRLNALQWDMIEGDLALDLAARIILPDDEDIKRFQRGHPLASDDATWRRAPGWAGWRALGSLFIATAGHPGGKPRWGPPVLDSLQRLIASIH